MTYEDKLNYLLEHPHSLSAKSDFAEWFIENHNNIVVIEGEE